MTPQEHNRNLAIGHFVYAGLHTLLMLGMAAFFWFFMSAVPNGPPASVMMFLISFVVLFNLFFTLPSFVAGYAMLKRKPWARTASIVAAVLEAMNVPVGTAVCIYTFWFLFSDAGKLMYDKNYQPHHAASDHYALRDAPPLPPDFAGWGTIPTHAPQRETEYTPPVQPPDWRS